MVIIVVNKDDLALIVMESSNGFGISVDKKLSKLRKVGKSYITDISEIHFSNGEGKVVINKSIRNKDVYILTDVYNHSITYQMHGKENHISPKEHFVDILSLISAIKNHARHVTVVMPMLYASRQHKRKGRESSDCALALKIIESLGVKCIITFDVHDPNVENAIPLLPFENFYPTKNIVMKMVENKEIDFNNLLVVSPDTGAMDRARYYADILKTDVGMFYKRRDLSKVVNGRNPIVAHEYLGQNVEGKDIVIVDDMISSGESILEVCEHLKQMKANNIYLVATFALFDKGLDNFNKAYEKGWFKKLYSTNLSYVNPTILEKEWYVSVDMSLYLAQIINTLNKEKPISPLLYDKQEVYEALENVKNKKNE